MSEIELDARNLPPPEPLMQALEAVDTLKPGQTLLLRVPREPVMLYPHLKEREMVWDVVAVRQGDWHIRIGYAL